jgi:hypothetical protein
LNSSEREDAVLAYIKSIDPRPFFFKPVITFSEFSPEERS